MKVLERYYKKIYSHTERLLKKVFGMSVIESMSDLNKTKCEIEKIIGKPISEITNEDLYENYRKNLSYKYSKYYTLNRILSVLSGASFLNSFCDEDIKRVKDE
jgi:hypothetical protein